MSKTKTAAMLAALVLGFTGIAAADAATLRCDGCSTTQLRNVAKSAGTGSHYIIDATNVKLTHWIVEYVPDGPTWVAYSVTVPTSVQTQFLDVMDRKAIAKAAGQTYSTIVINTKTGFNESYLGGFSDITGYDIASDVGLRNSVGQTLAQNYSGFLPGLFSVLLSISTPATAPITIRFVITLDNGAQISFQLTSAQIERAQYQLGKSVDKDGHPIPDASVTNEQTVRDTYTGTYRFNDASTLTDWLDAARAAGVPITGTPTVGGGMSCSWNGRVLACRSSNN